MVADNLMVKNPGSATRAVKHPLDPLLRPRSVAIVGASTRAESMGAWSLTNLKKGGYKGSVYPVNPRYDQVDGIRCYRSLAELPETPDMVIFAVGDHRLEQALDEAIARGIPAAVMMSSLYFDGDTEPLLRARVQQKIRKSRMQVCGANGMGFYNVRDHVWACGFDSRMHVAPGNVSLISHSGSGMSGIIDCEERLRVNFAVSAGNELSVAMDQYLDFVLDLPETKAVGLFIETARNPAGFRKALEKAVRKQVPVVALKVGRSQKSAALAVSHSGAMAGDDATYDALFDRYGVHRVADMDELATALILFSEFSPLRQGSLVALHDSGGERQLIVDLADEAGVPLTELGADTVEKLERVLDPELPAINPLDAWSRGGETASEKMSECLSLMMQDTGAAIGAVMHDRGPNGAVYKSYVRYMEIAHEASGKPVALVAARQGSGSDPLAITETHRGFPVLDGVMPFLRGVRGLMNYRDFLAMPRMSAPIAPAAAVAGWSAKLTDGCVLDEQTSLSMLSDFGIDASATEITETGPALLAASKKFSWPLVLKTAMPEMQHKTEQRGVILNIEDERQLAAAYADLATRLGPRVLVTTMAPEGIEMIMGARRDPQFGPVILLGFGGILAEVVKDVVFALPPFDAACARRMLDKLNLRSILDGVRGRPPAAIDRFCEMAADFSAMVAALEDVLLEVDVNPVIVGENSCIAVDALVVGKKR
jgi:acyl-CoA synthetase (NDP forming)